MTKAKSGKNGPITKNSEIKHIKILIECFNYLILDLNGL